MNYKVFTSAIVDGDKWITIKCNKESSAWIKTQPKIMWYEHIDTNWVIHKHTFDIHEKIYTMLQLKYGHD